MRARSARFLTIERCKHSFFKEFEAKSKLMVHMHKMPETIHVTSVHMKQHSVPVDSSSGRDTREEVLFTQATWGRESMVLTFVMLITINQSLSATIVLQ